MLHVRFNSWIKRSSSTEFLLARVRIKIVFWPLRRCMASLSSSAKTNQTNASKAKVTSRHGTDTVFHVWHAFRFEAFSDLLSFSLSRFALSQAYPLQVWFVFIFSSCLRRRFEKFLIYKKQVFSVNSVISAVWNYIFLDAHGHEHKTAQFFEGFHD